MKNLGCNHIKTETGFDKVQSHISAFNYVSVICKLQLILFTNVTSFLKKVFLPPKKTLATA